MRTKLILAPLLLFATPAFAQEAAPQLPRELTDPATVPRLAGTLQAVTQAVLNMKFGGTSMAGIERIRHVASLVKREADRGNQLAVVVSAMGEGLVGSIAAEGRILNLAEAADHPAFLYKPETGEERFHSFAGVPIVRLESPIGVLAVQHE